jgi:cytochrome c553
VALAALISMASPAWAQGSFTTSPLNSVERHALNPDRELLDQGENVAATACASCHGIDGVSTGPGIPNLAGQRSVYLYRVLQNYQSRGRRNDAMNHAVGFLNEEALLTVAAYYASLAPARPEIPAEDSAQAVSVEGGDPFAGIRDDLKKGGEPHEYKWLMQTLPDLKVIHPAKRTGSNIDLVIGDDQNRRLLVRVLEAGSKSEIPEATLKNTTIIDYSKTFRNKTTHYTRLEIPVNDTLGNFTVLLFPFQQGETLPTTDYDKQNNKLIVRTDKHVDAFTLTRDKSGLSKLTLE